LVTISGEDEEGFGELPSNQEQKKSPLAGASLFSLGGLDLLFQISSGPPPCGNGPFLTVPISRFP
jgi:hypothetical protein